MIIKELFVNKRAEIYKIWADFLRKYSIREESSIDYTCGVFENEVLIATGSLYGNIIKCVAVDEEMRGGNVFNHLISHLMEEISSRGGQDFYVYTKPDLTQSFEYLGFKVISAVDDVLVFMERSVNGLSSYINYLKLHRNDGENNSAIVMNANPFTLGHRYLVETASSQSSTVYLFVVAEDSSVFPFKTRFQLVSEGCSDLENVIVLSTSNYMVSSQTFPSYFINETSDITQIHAKLDATLFKRHIASILDIKKRYVGEEPLSLATNIYNNSLREVLEPEVEVTVMPRLQEGESIISASKVRELLGEGKINSAKQMVPPTTYDYLLSEEGLEVIESIKTRRK